MALKLELWLSAKEQAGRPPLRPVIQTTSSQRRASGHLAAISATESPTRTRKSFSRIRSSSFEGDSNNLSTTAKAANSPGSPLTRAVIKSPMLMKNSRLSFTEDHVHDEKENQPLKDKNIKLNSTCNDKSIKTPWNNESCENIRVNDAHLHPASPLLNSLILPVVTECTETGLSINDDQLDIIQDFQMGLECNVETIEANDSLSLDPLYSEISIEKKDSDENLEEKNAAKMAIEELQAMIFLNSIQEQKIIELEQIISKDRLEQNETSLSRGKKHKAEVKRLATERANYEERANQMIKEMGEQMSLLQNMAMSRIEV